MRLHKGITTMTFKYKEGALTCDVPIEGITDDLLKTGTNQVNVAYYGNRYFICESITLEQAQTIAAGIVMFYNRLTADYEIPIIIKE